MAARETKIPGIPSVPAGDYQQSINALKEIIEIREGRRGLPADRFIRFADIQGLDLTGSYGTFTKDNLPSNCTDPIDPPTNFVVTKGVWYNHLTWTDPDDENVAAIEVWCNTTSARSEALLLAIVPIGQEKYDHPISDELTQDHYYWIRSRGFNPDVHSTWVPTDEMGGELVPGDDSVAETISKVLSILEEQITETQLYGDLNTRLDKIETTETAVAQNTSDISDHSAAIASRVQITDYLSDLSIWDGDTTYYKGNQVHYNGKLYEFIYASGRSGILPTYTTYWKVASGTVLATAIAEEKLWVGSGGSGTPTTPASGTLLDHDDILSAQWTVKLNVNNHIAGVGLALSESGSSEFIILADKFAIVKPGATPGTNKFPFIVGEVDEVETVGVNGALVVDGTILARSITVDNLAAIKADMGAITAGTITLPSGGHIKSGQTDYNTGTGFWLGNVSGTPKGSIGNPSGDYARWTGSHLEIGGDIIATGNIKANNVTVPVSAYTESAQDIDISTETTITSISITTSGGKVLVSWSCMAYSPGSAARLFTFKLKRGSTVVQTFTNVVVWGSGQCTTVAASFGETPSSASHTYTVTAYQDGYSPACKVENASITIIEAKR